MDKYTIELKDLKIRAFHGYYKKEQEIGSFFIVNLAVQYFSSVKQDSSLDDSVNYEQLFRIVTQGMKNTKPLLEDVCLVILEKIEVAFPFISQSAITIEKINPPISHFNGKSVKVSLERKYEKH